MRPPYSIPGDEGEFAEPLRLDLLQPAILRTLRCCEPPLSRSGWRSSGRSTLRHGRLLPGLHDLTLRKLRACLLSREPWTHPWRRALDFLAWPGRSGDFSHAFLRSESGPDGKAQIEVSLLVRQAYGPEAMAALAPFFGFGLDEIAKVYGVRLIFWVENFPAGIDFGTLRRLRLGDGEGAESGVIRLSLHDWPL
jgi:hypothetical protein